MKKPTKIELETIQKCAKRISSNRWIPGYDKDDIYQEAVIIGIEGLKWYNGSIPLDKYLDNHIKHKLRSLRTEKYIKPGCDCGECLKCRNNTARHNIEYTVDVSLVQDLLTYDQKDSIEMQETLDYLDQSIPAEFRDDYLKLLTGVSLVTSRKKKLIAIIEELLNE